LDLCAVNRDQAAHEHFGLPWAEVQARARAYIERAEAGVARWEWLVGDELPEVPAPISLEPPRTLRAEPEERDEAMHAGYDADGEIVVVRYFADGAPFVEAAVVDGVVLRFMHEPNGRLALEQLIDATHTDDGRLDVIREYNRGSAVITWCAWDEDRPTHAVEERYDGELGLPSALRERTRTDYEYDAQGLLRIRVTTEHHHSGDSVGDTLITWVRSSPEALEAAHALVLEQLPDRIRAWAARVAPKDEPVFALGVLHSLDDPSLPPALALGTVHELREIRAHCGDDPATFTRRVFSTFEFDRWEGLASELTGDPALDDAYALLDRHWEQTDAVDEPEALLRACVRQLQTLDWSECLTPAETFVIFVMETDAGDDILELVEATVPRGDIEAVKVLE
jgi:hypothetical protein